MDKNISSEPQTKAYLTHLLNEMSSLEDTDTSKIEKKQIQNHLENINKQAELELKKICELACQENDDAIEISKELSDKLYHNQLYYLHQKVSPLELDEKTIIRADFNGFIDKPEQHLLSDKYKNNKASAENNTNYINKKMLENNPAWKKISQFPNFKNLENKTIEQLNKMGINQKTLNSMNSFDFLDTIYKSTNRKKGSTPIFVGEKEKFVKNFISRFEKEFTAILGFSEVDERYITAVVKAMKEKGCCGNIVVKNKNGEVIKTPKLSIDHKNPMRNAKSLDSLAKINLFSNFQIVLDDKIHINLINLLNIENKKNSFKQIGFKDKNIVFAFGLSTAEQISFDYSETPQEKRKAKEIDSLKIPKIIPKKALSR